MSGIRFAVLCSGNGTNLQAIIDAVKAGKIRGSMEVVFSDQPGCYALTRARKSNIPVAVLEKKDFGNREDYDAAILSELEEHHLDLIVLAGYMRVLGPAFVRRYHGRIMNIHPALLPSFKGTDGMGDALSYAVKVTGVSVHFVDEGMDTGPIILQEAVVINEDDTKETLAARVHEVEHRLYPRAIALFADGKLKIEGRRVRVLGA